MTLQNNPYHLIKDFTSVIEKIEGFEEIRVSINLEVSERSFEVFNQFLKAEFLQNGVGYSAPLTIPDTNTFVYLIHKPELDKY